MCCGSDELWRRVFSGWLFKESPSLNVVEHPIYDVWTKDCAMNHPRDRPGDGVAVGAQAAAARRPSASRSAPKSRAVTHAQRRSQQRHIIVARDLDRAERGEMLGDELAVEQAEAAGAEPRDEVRERDLRGVASRG